MIFAISQYTTLPREKVTWINDVSLDLESFFKNSSYGNDLDGLYFGLITVKPEEEEFFKKRRPIYKQGGKIQTDDGRVIKSNGYAEIYAKIDYTEIFQLKKAELIDRVFKEILNECNSLTRLSKLKDFNYNLFKSDFQNYLIDQSYIKL